MAVDMEGLPERRASRFSFRESPTFILLTVCVAIFNDVFLFGTIIPVLPFALPGRLHIDYKEVQIAIAILLAMYGGALMVGSLVFGWIGDRLPRRHPLFLFGLCNLLAATAVLSLGRHLIVMAIGRFLQGLAAAIVWTSGLALLTDIFGQKRYGEAIGYAQTSVSVGTTCAPLLGGLVYARGGYSAVSTMNCGAVIVSVVLALLMVEPKSGIEWQGPDAAEPDHEVDRTTSNTSDHPSATEQTYLISKKASKSKSNKSSVYFLLLRSPRILAAMGGIFTYSFVVISFEGMIPLFVKETFGWNSTRAALVFLSWIIPGFLAPVAGKLADRIGPRWIAAGGFLFAAPPLVLMRLITNDSPFNQGLLVGLLTLVGFGLVAIMPSCISDLSSAAADLKREKPSEFGEMGALTQAYGLFVFSYSCGTLFGPTAVGLIRTKASWGSATATLAGACVLASIPIMLRTSNGSRRKAPVNI